VNRLASRNRLGEHQSLSELERESDALLERMQTLKARKGVQAAFKASPAELGRTAVTKPPRKREDSRSSRRR